MAPNRAWVALVALTALGCGGGNYVLVENGGVDVPAGACADVTISTEMAIVAPRAVDCADRRGFTLPPHAAAAFWRVGDSRWAGPVTAASATVEAAVAHPLQSGASSQGLVSGSSDKGLQSGASATGLRSGSSDKGLQSGASASGLQSGASASGLQSGASASGLQSGASASGLQSGASAGGLQSGASAEALASGSAAVASLALAKRGEGRATAEKPARFVLTVANVSDVDLAAVTVVDRVDPALRVADSAATALPDGSTLVVFRSNEPLRARSSRAFVVEVYAR